MRYSFAVVLSVVFILQVHAAPQVSSVSVTPSADSPRIAVSYQLSADAVVTVRFRLGDELIPANRSVWVGGDVNEKVSATTGTDVRTLYWAPDKEDWGESGPPSLANVKAVVTAWSPDAPPDYLVADLMATNCVRYYASADALPGGISNAVYKTSKMVFRKIPAQDVVWKMGLVSADNGSIRPFRKNKLTADFYLGVYAVTQGQSLLFAGHRGGGKDSWKTAEDSPRRPVCGLTFLQLLGGNDAFTPSASSDVGKFRALTGLSSVTLPTEAQWEYACRAGSADHAYWGDTISPSESGKYAWVSNNLSGDELRPHEVGLLLANGYGLYDMLGNVCECCLDYLGKLDSDTTNIAENFVQTTKPDSGKRVMKGSCYAYDIWNARTAYYFGGGLGSSGMGGGYECGYRLAIPLAAQ